MFDLFTQLEKVLEIPQEKSIRDFIKLFNKDIKVRFIEGQAQSDMKNKIIYFDLYDYYYKLKNEKHILQFLSKNYNFNELSLPTIMLLHELGHIETAKSYYNLNGLLRQYEKQVIKINESKKTISKKIELYNNLRLEKDAFIMAQKIYNDNKCIIKAFDSFMLRQ